MDELGTRLDAEIHTTLSATDVHIFNLCTLGEVLYDGGAVEDGIDDGETVIRELLGHVAEDDMQALTEQLLIGFREVVEEQGAEAALCGLLRLATYQAVDVWSVAVDELAQDVDAQITCSTCNQYIA